MAFCGLFAFVLGYLAGLRFRVAVVLPIEVAAMVAAAGWVSAGQAGTGIACLGFIVFSFALQTGYGLAIACPLPSRRAIPRPLKA